MGSPSGAGWYNSSMFNEKPSHIRIVYASCFALLAIGLPGCAKRALTTGPSNNIFRIAMTTEPVTFDPADVQDVPTGELLQNVYEGLIKWTPDNKIAPAIAETWTISKDGRTYIFKLRPGVKFHSGKLVTAQDVVYSLSRGFFPSLASPVAVTYMGDIVGAADVSSGKTKTLAGVKAIDPETVSITIDKPKGYWLNNLTYPTAYILNKDAVDKDPGGNVTAQNEDGTGPFIITSYSRGQAVDLKANPNYWGGAPKIAGIHMPIITDQNTRHSLYLAGQLDLVDLSEGEVEHDQSDPVLGKQLKFWKRAITDYLYLNQKAYAPFKDVRVRQAFAYATDKNKIVRLVYNGHRDVANDMLPEGIPGFDPSFKGIQYNVEKAKQLLSTAGYLNGKGLPVLQIYYNGSRPDTQKVVDTLRQMYEQDLGVNVQPRPTEFATLIKMETNNTLPALCLGWSADYLDPQDFYSLLFGSKSIQNHTGYSSPAFDALCEKADSDRNQSVRLALYQRAAAIVVNDAPAIPLYYDKSPELIKPYVHNLDDSLMGHLPYVHLTLGQ
jgi:oligopeptide transport system substrate-binding protein